VSTRSFIERPVAVDTSKERSIRFGCTGKIDISIEQLPELSPRTGASIQSPHRHRGGRIVTCAARPSENHSTRICARGALELSCPTSKILEVSGFDSTHVRHYGLTDEHLSSVKVGSLFNARIVSDLVFLIDDGLIGCAVAGGHMSSFMSHEESGAARLVVLVPKQDDGPFLDDACDTLKRRGRKCIQRYDRYPAAPEITCKIREGQWMERRNKPSPR
jgi:hypothetical protein